MNSTITGIDQLRQAVLQDRQQKQQQATPAYSKWAVHQLQNHPKYKTFISEVPKQLYDDYQLPSKVKIGELESDRLVHLMQLVKASIFCDNENDPIYQNILNWNGVSEKELIEMGRKIPNFSMDHWVPNIKTFRIKFYDRWALYTKIKLVGITS
jgi:hypothetical protein